MVVAEEIINDNAASAQGLLTTSSRRCTACRRRRAAAPRGAATDWAGKARRLHAPQPAVGVAARAGTGETKWRET